MFEGLWGFLVHHNQALKAEVQHFSSEIRVSTPDTTLNSGAASPDRGELALPLLQPELDPDALRSDLRDFIQELRETQRERVKEKKTNAIGGSSQGHLGRVVLLLRLDGA